MCCSADVCIGIEVLKAHDLLPSLEVSLLHVSSWGGQYTTPTTQYYFFQDEQLLRSQFDSSSATSQFTDLNVQESDIVAKVLQLERQVVWAPTPQTLLSSIDELFKFLLPSEQRTLVQKVLILV